MSTVSEYLKSINRVSGHRLAVIATQWWEEQENITFCGVSYYSTLNKRNHSRTYKKKHRDKKKFFKQRVNRLSAFYFARRKCVL